MEGKQQDNWYDKMFIKDIASYAELCLGLCLD